MQLGAKTVAPNFGPTRLHEKDCMLPRIIASVLIAVGLAIGFIAFTMPINAPGTSIVNLSRMADRQNLLLVSAVVFIAGAIGWAADHVRRGTSATTPGLSEADTLVWETWAPRVAIASVTLAFLLLGVHWSNERLISLPSGTLTIWFAIPWIIWSATPWIIWSATPRIIWPSIPWKAWVPRVAIAAVILMFSLLGVHWQNEWLTFLPFWALIIWNVWKARYCEGGSLIGTTGIVFGLSVASVTFALVFEPEYASRSWYDEHNILPVFGLAQLAVAAGAAIFAVVLGVRAFLNHRRTASSF